MSMQFAGPTTKSLREWIEEYSKQDPKLKAQELLRTFKNHRTLMNTPTLQVLLGSFLPWHSGTGWMRHTAREHVQDVLVSFVARFVARWSTVNRWWIDGKGSASEIRHSRCCCQASSDQCNQQCNTSFQIDFRHLSTFNQSLFTCFYHVFLTCFRIDELVSTRTATEPNRNETLRGS